MTQTRGWRLVLAPRDAPPSVRRFAKRARQRRLRAALPWLVVLGVIALLGAAAAVVYLTPALGVERIEVSGASTLDPDSVRRAAAVRDGTPLARLDLGAVERRVRALKPVREARVTARYPHTSWSPWWSAPRSPSCPRSAASRCSTPTGWPTSPSTPRRRACR
ncbi:cell division protein FtsQ/DivIB [Dactylosporangium darangshiense]|uniref:cell division protein FtsQ/DivIB n=1 Tax=Dactylosporangium darangshiense TaxID=579108 RepID=UPI003638A243